MHENRAFLEVKRKQHPDAMHRTRVPHARFDATYSGRGLDQKRTGTGTFFSLHQGSGGKVGVDEMAKDSLLGLIHRLEAFGLKRQGGWAAAYEMERSKYCLSSSVDGEVVFLESKAAPRSFANPATDSTPGRPYP